MLNLTIYEMKSIILSHKLPKIQMTKNLFLLFSFLAIFFAESLFAQDLIQLRSSLKNKMHDTTRINILNKIVELIEDDETYSNNENVISIAEKNLKQSNLSKHLIVFYKKSIANSYYWKGIYYFNNSDFQKSILYHRKSLKIFNEIKIESLKANSYYEIGKIFTIQGDYSEAIKTFYLGLRIYEKFKDNLGIADCYAAIGQVYSTQNQLTSAISMNKLGIKYYRLSSDYPGVCISLCEISDCLITQKKYKEAAYFLDQTNQYTSQLSNYELALIEMQKGALAEQLLQPDIALVHYKNSLKRYEEDQEVRFVCSLNFLIGRTLFVQKKQKESGLKYVLASLAVAEEYGFSNDIERSNLLLFEIYKSMNKTGQSLNHLEKYVEILDKRNSEEIKNTLLTEQLKYEFEKKQLQEKLKSEKNINLIKLKAEKSNFRKNIIIVISVFIILISGLIVYFNIKSNRQKQTIEEQKNSILRQKLLVSQMNPHFIFNSLNAIQNCIFKDESLKAGNYLTQFALLMRMILDFSVKDFISLEEEIALLENYLQLQAFRFDNKFQYNIVISSDIIPSQTQIPPMLSQPFIENAIEHGIFYLKENGLIEVKIFQKSNLLHFEITDNGVGLKKSESLKPQTKNHNSLALKITQDRINVLFAEKNEFQNIKIIDLCQEDIDKQGVSVTFAIPLLKTIK